MTADTPIRGSWVDAESEEKRLELFYCIGMRLSNFTGSVHTTPAGKI